MCGGRLESGGRGRGSKKNVGAESVSKIEWQSFFKMAVTHFHVRPKDFWAMTPVEFWWMYPKEEKPTGAMTREWVEEMMRRYPDGNHPPRNHHKT